jgi:integrase
MRHIARQQSCHAICYPPARCAVAALGASLRASAAGKPLRAVKVLPHRGRCVRGKDRARNAAGIELLQGGARSVRYQNRVPSAVQGFCRWLHAEGVLPHDLSSALEYAREPQTLPKNILTPQEACRVIEAADTSTAIGYRDRVILETFYATGIRKTELMQLAVDDVRLDEELLRVNGGKGAKDRVVPLTRIACAGLENYIKAVRPQLLRKNEPARRSADRTAVPLAARVAALAQRARRRGREMRPARQGEEARDVSPVAALARADVAAAVRFMEIEGKSPEVIRRIGDELLDAALSPAILPWRGTAVRRRPGMRKLSHRYWLFFIRSTSRTVGSTSCASGTAAKTRPRCARRRKRRCPPTPQRAASPACCPAPPSLPLRSLQPDRRLQCRSQLFRQNRCSRIVVIMVYKITAASDDCQLLVAENEAIWKNLSFRLHTEKNGQYAYSEVEVDRRCLGLRLHDVLRKI